MAVIYINNYRQPSKCKLILSKHSYMIIEWRNFKYNHLKFLILIYIFNWYGPLVLMVKSSIDIYKYQIQTPPTNRKKLMLPTIINIINSEELLVGQVYLQIIKARMALSTRSMKSNRLLHIELLLSYILLILLSETIIHLIWRNPWRWPPRKKCRKQMLLKIWYGYPPNTCWKECKHLNIAI